VLENPVDAPHYADARVLRFGGEIFSYETYTDKPPFRFTGVRRGYWKTKAAAHPRGEIGGVLDVSEYAAISCYIDQKTDLQDEIAEKIAKIYNLGFEFCYFDGSEGVNEPYEIYVPLSQYRVCKKFKKMPIFTEGAAKAHFGWHLQAGANAFDTFPPETFKPMIAKYPLEEAPIMRRDFTRLDFGWWHLAPPGEHYKGIGCSIGSQLDMVEYGASKAASWDCPETVMMRFPGVTSIPRFDDLAEAMRRWEDVRVKNLMTDEWRAKLRDPKREFHLYKAKEGAPYELVEWRQIPVGGKEYAPGLRVFLFERGGKRVVAYWHTSGRARYVLKDAASTVVEAEGLKYFETDMSAADAEKAFAESVLAKDR
jgi:hypothetical protein